MITILVYHGYDWLYDSLQPDTRRVVREAIIAKGFDAAKNTRHAWFYTAKNLSLIHI